MFNVLNSDLELEKDADTGFDTEREAIAYILEHKEHAENVFYVENDEGDFVCIVYGGAVWRPEE